MQILINFLVVLLLGLILFFDPSGFDITSSNVKQFETHIFGCMHHPHRSRRSRKY
jgi:hypothetical protein